MAAALVVACSGCGGGGGGGDATEAPVQAQAAVPVVVLTFDEHSPAAALSIMRPRGLVGTYFATPGVSDPTLMAELRASGWSVQGYSGRNMTTLSTAEARAQLAEVKRGMAALGFTITALAPTQRAWNAELRGLAQEAGYSTVRVASDGGAQPYPFPDPLYVQHGGTASLSADDTAESLVAHLNGLQGAWIVVVHKVGDDSDPAYSVRAAVFAAFCDRLAADAKAGKLRIVTL